MKRPPEYWNAVAKSIEAEDEKARIYASSHNHTLGVSREAILRSEMRRETPHPFVVTTGFVCHHTNPKDCSNQVDILVYDPQPHPVQYEAEGFSIVSQHSAKIAVEVKSNLDKEEFGKALTVSRSVRELSSDSDQAPNYIESMLFGFERATFNTLIKHLRTAATNQFWHAPFVIAVHSRNYFVCRGTGWSLSDSPMFIGVDFGRSRKNSGLATAAFLHWYTQFLTNTGKTYRSTIRAWVWKHFDRFHRVEIHNDGEVIDFPPGELRLPEKR